MSVTTLIIARHGNTFAPGEEPRRVGLNTDLPLIESGEEQATKLGKYLKEHLLLPDRIFTSNLQRTRQTAILAAQAMGIFVPEQALEIFNEIDYGADENKTEPEVKARLGETALSDWEKKGVMPDGWSPSSESIKQNWQDFADTVFADFRDSKTLVVTSNGIARFALNLTGKWDEMRETHGLKLATGAFSVLTRRADDQNWTVVGWNIRP